MTQGAFYNVFVDLLKDIFDAENQIVQNLPKIILAASNSDLKEALSSHLEETKNHVQRLKKIFKTLNENPTGMTCKAMKGLFEEGDEIIKKKDAPAVKDASLIIACQKVEHYEISSYGSAIAIARHLTSGSHNRVDFDEIVDILQQTLDEESSADEKLTDLAEGGFFTKGINEEAEKEEKPSKPSKPKSTPSR
jgi:ferritin-like metal-binding protein YciE